MSGVLAWNTAPCHGRHQADCCASDRLSGCKCEAELLNLEIQTRSWLPALKEKQKKRKWTQGIARTLDP